MKKLKSFFSLILVMVFFLGGFSVLGNESIIEGRSAWAFADIDGDGDRDRVFGSANGTLAYFQNDSNGFTFIRGSQSPFYGIDVGQYAVPRFVNLDDDIDLELVVMNDRGEVRYFDRFENWYYEKTAGAGAFPIPLGHTTVDFWLTIRLNRNIVEILEDTYDTLDGKEVFSTASDDLDGDGDVDVLLGMLNGAVYYFQKESNGDFTLVEGIESPFNGVDVGTNAIPILVQFDSDPEFEVLVDGLGRYNTLIKMPMGSMRQHFKFPYSQEQTGKAKTLHLF